MYTWHLLRHHCCDQLTYSSFPSKSSLILLTALGVWKENKLNHVQNRYTLNIPKSKGLKISKFRLCNSYMQHMNMC